MRIALLCPLAVAVGCGVVSGIDQLENVSGVASGGDAAVEASPSVEPSGDAGVESGAAACAELFCDDFEDNDDILPSRIGYDGPACALDDSQHASGSRSMRCSVSNGAAPASAIIPTIAPIPIDGHIVISFAFKRADDQSPALAQFNVGIDLLLGNAGSTAFVEQSGPDLAQANMSAITNFALNLGFVDCELSITKTGDGSAAGRVKATLELKLDGTTTATLPDLDMADTITSLEVGVVGQPGTTTVWIDDLVVSKR